MRQIMQISIHDQPREKSGLCLLPSLDVEIRFRASSAEFGSSCHLNHCKNMLTKQSLRQNP